MPTSVERLDQAELSEKLTELELNWIREGLPLKRRAAESFKVIYGSVLDESGRRELFDELTVWYVNKYGSEAMQWDGIIGRIPVQLRGEIYFVSVPFVTETTLVKFTDRFENLPANIADALTPEEFDELGRKVSAATIYWQYLYTLSVDDSFLDLKNRQLLRRAILDIEGACAVLSSSSDTQGAIFSAHAASEKFLKIAFRQIHSQIEVKDFGHNSKKLFRKLIELAPRYSWLEKSVVLLQEKLGPRMDIRYEVLARSTDDAVSAIYASLFLCGTLAHMWTLDHLRGSTNASFVAARFYTDGASSTYYCKSVASDEIVLLLFQQNRWTGRQLVELSIPASNASLYLEVTDQAKDSVLRVILLEHLRNPGPRVSPEEIGVKYSDSGEGVHITALIKRSKI